MIRNRSALVAIGGVTAALALTACGGSQKGATAVNTSVGQQVPQASGGAGGQDGYGSSASGGTYGSAAGGYGSSAGGSSAAGSAAGVQETALKTKWTTSIGTIVVDGKNWTMYRFDKDTAKPAKSNCNGACASTWPPALWSDNLQLTGVKRGLVGKVRRDDGKWQVTINGWPIYRYAKDQPGTWRGEGVGKVWYAIAPTGKKAVKCKPSMAWGSGSGSASASNAVWLSAVTKRNIGKIVVENKDWTVYRFDKDQKGKSNCYGACAKLWPAVAPKDVLQLQGISRGLVGKIKRNDGTWQLTIAGWPIYRYAKDSPGKWKGQGVGKVWWALRANGAKAVCLPTMGSGSGSAGSGSGSYGGGSGSSSGSSGGGYGGSSY